MNSIEEIKEGNYFKFKSAYKGNPTVYAFTCLIDENEDPRCNVRYVRDSLTRWCAGIDLFITAEKISENEFFERVKFLAKKEGYPIPTNEQIKGVLKYYYKNFDGDIEDVYKILGLETPSVLE
jgi:hypothetical protein